MKASFFYRYRILLQADRQYRIHLLTCVVPYEIITYVLEPTVFFRITYGAVCVPDLEYALRHQLRTVRDNSVKQSVKNGPTVETA